MDTGMNTNDPAQNVTRIYDAMAQKYTRLFWDDVSDDAETDRFLALVPTGGSILDAGCGPGNNARGMLAKGFRVTGIDLSEEFLKIARELIPQGEFHLMDMRRMSFPDATFDSLYSAYSFLHLRNTDTTPTLREYARVLRPGGALFLATKTGVGETFLPEPLANNQPLFLNLVDPEWLATAVADAGFTILDRIQKQPTTPSEIPNEKVIFLCKRSE